MSNVHPLHSQSDKPIGHFVRISNFGMNASVTAIKRLIDLAWSLQNYHTPLIAENVGGLTGISLAAFGAVGGISHGIAEKENSDNEKGWVM